jgi:nitroreductase
MPENEALKRYLLTRRSVGPAFLAEPGPDAEQLETLLRIATRVPDHGKLAPWRVILYSGEGRERAGAALADLVRRRQPEVDQERLDVEARQFLPAPLVVGVLSTASEHPKIPEIEQLLSAGNVAFNLVHGAYALGFAAQWVTRWYAYDPEAAALLGAKAREQFVGFVHIGMPTTTMEDRPRPDLAAIATQY